MSETVGSKVETTAGSKRSKLDSRSQTVAQLLFDRVAATPEREAFRYPVNGDWRSVSWKEFGDRARRLGAGLIALGIEPEQRVALASSTRYEWVLADVAVMVAGAATTTVYPTTMPTDVAYILGDSESRVVFAEDDEQVKKLRGERAKIPDVVKVVTFDPVTDEGTDDWVISLGALEELGEQHLREHPDAIEKATTAITGDSLATLIYTSGTTGRPKGVRLAHDTWTYEAAAIDELNLMTIDDVQFLWLPLSHVFGKVLIALPLQIGFVTAVDGRIDKIVENLGEVKPTFSAAAPRIFEKARGRIVTMVESEGGVKAKLFAWAFGVGHKVGALREEGREPSGVLAAQYRLADKLVLSKIRERFGGRLRFFVSGSAALNPDLARWFHAAGILIIEGYGLTETAAATCLNRPHDNKFGTIGQPFPGTEARIADDGELLVRGPGVMRGYHNLPELTAEAIDSDGWYHTGDVGEILESGHIRITDRKKDLFKTSGGKYIAPGLVEAQFKAICPYAAQMVVHGEGRNYCTALVTLDPESIQSWVEEHQLGDRSYGEIVTSDAAREMVQGYIDQLNAKLNRWETIKDFAILPKDLTVEDGEITPSMKMRRTAVEQRYSDVLDSMYPDG